MEKVRAFALSVTASLVGALGGCGGGGGESPTPAPAPAPTALPEPAPAPAAKQYDFTPYAGTWSVCDAYASTSTSRRYQVVITQAGPGGFHYAWQVADHATADCSGPGTVHAQEEGDVTALGETVQVDGIDAQKVTARIPRDMGCGPVTVTETQVVALSPKGLHNGDPEVVDEDGTMHFQPYVLTKPETVVPLVAPPPPAVAPPPPPCQ